MCGRTTKPGQSQPKLAQRLADPATHWQPHTVALWYGRTNRRVEIATETAVWYHSGLPPVPIRWLLVRDPTGELDTHAFLATDLDVTPYDMLQWFVLRWQIEVTFEEARAHLGMETQRQWSDRAILRTTPALLGLFSLICLWVHDLQAARAFAPRAAAWYPKTHPTFSDAIAAVRREIWQHQNSCTSRTSAGVGSALPAVAEERHGSSRGCSLPARVIRAMATIAGIGATRRNAGPLPNAIVPHRWTCYIAAMSASLKLPVWMSVRDFLAWEPGDGQRYELVDGQPRAMAPPGTIHGFLQNELGSLIRNHLREHRRGCEVLANPGVIPRLLSAHNVRIPDLGVTCSPLVPGQSTLPDPVLLIEILSPSNQAETWSNVWAYTSIPSVQEILLLQSTRIGAEVLRRGAGSNWPEETDQIPEGGELVLDSIGFRVPLVELYQRAGLTRE